MTTQRKDRLTRLAEWAGLITIVFTVFAYWNGKFETRQAEIMNKFKRIETIQMYQNVVIFGDSNVNKERVKAWMWENMKSELNTRGIELK